MYLARAGHNVTMLISEKDLFPYSRGHYTITMIEAYKDLKNFSVITEVRATGISAEQSGWKDEGDCCRTHFAAGRAFVKFSNSEPSLSRCCFSSLAKTRKTFDERSSPTMRSILT
jgi:hypothetical protein